MPRRAKRFCAGRCGLIVESRYCDACAPKFSRETDRRSAHARGYDRRWREFRLVYLRDNPLCVDCFKDGYAVAATDVHHIQKLANHPELKYEPANLMALCSQHHDGRTASGE